MRDGLTAFLLILFQLVMVSITDMMQNPFPAVKFPALYLFKKYWLTVNSFFTLSRGTCKNCHIVRSKFIWNISFVLFWFSLSSFKLQPRFEAHWGINIYLLCHNCHHYFSYSEELFQKSLQLYTHIMLQLYHVKSINSNLITRNKRQWTWSMCFLSTCPKTSSAEICCFLSENL